MASAICSPTVKTGFSEVMGSWKIIEISLPRIFRICAGGKSSRFLPLYMIRPSVMRPGGVGIRRMIDSAVTLLPQPDSPTTPSVSPLLM